MAAYSTWELAEAFAELYRSHKYSDCTIMYGKDCYPAHKAIIGPRSEYFDGLFSRVTKKRKPCVVTLDGEDEPEAVKSMMYFFYHQQYPENPADHIVQDDKVPDFESPTDYTPSESTVSDWDRDSIYSYKTSTSLGAPTESTAYGQNLCGRGWADDMPCKVLLHLKVDAIAAKYKVPSLQERASQSFVSACQNSSSYSDYDQFATVAHWIYQLHAPHDHEMKFSIVTAILKHPELLDDPLLQLMSSDTELSHDIVMEWRKRSSSSWHGAV